MATRSRVGLYDEQKDETRSIYIHWDGYPSARIPLLNNFYNTYEKADALIKLGDASYLDESIDNPPGHSFDHPAKGCSIFYNRDRGEIDIDFQTDKGKNLTNREGYDYLFFDGKWHISYSNNEWKDISNWKATDGD